MLSTVPQFREMQCNSAAKEKPGEAGCCHTPLTSSDKKTERQKDKKTKKTKKDKKKTRKTKRPKDRKTESQKDKKYNAVMQ